MEGPCCPFPFDTLFPGLSALPCPPSLSSRSVSQRLFLHPNCTNKQTQSKATCIPFHADEYLEGSSAHNKQVTYFWTPTQPKKTWAFRDVPARSLALSSIRKALPFPSLAEIRYLKWNCLKVQLSPNFRIAPMTKKSREDFRKCSPARK